MISLFKYIYILSVILLSCILMPLYANAWQLEGSEWVGADEIGGDTPYELKITNVTAIEETGFVYEIEGMYKSGFADHGDCTHDWYPLRGYYYEPTATIAFSVAWYNSHNAGCRTTSSFAGYIYTEADLRLKTVERFPETPPSIAGIQTWTINFERQEDDE